MSEPYDATPADFTDSLALDADQTAAMRQQWIGLGLDPGEFDQAAGRSGVLPGNLAPPPPAADATTAAVEIMPDTKTPTLSAAQVEDLVAEMIRAGIPEASIREALEADGYTAVTVSDDRTDDEKDFDKAFSPARPE